MNAQLLAASDVTSEKVANIFSQAFLAVTRDDDGDVIVQGEGVKVFILSDQERKLLKYSAIFPLVATRSLEHKRAFISRLNNEMIFVRFAVPKENENVLYCDYILPLEGGVTAHQIVASFRIFSRVIVSALRAYEELGMVG
jgi:hypothetical protein